MVSRPSVAAIVPAAGEGRRLRAACPKPLVRIGGIPLMVRTLRALLDAYSFNEVLLAVDPARIGFMGALLKRHGLPDVRPVAGGKLRAESVRNAFLAMDPGTRIVLVHDVARPFVGRSQVEGLIDAARRHGAALLAEPATATVKLTLAGAKTVRKTLDRRRIFMAQTPQVFRVPVLKEAYRRAGMRFAHFTDEAGLAEAAGFCVRIVAGPSTNIKITSPSDLILAEALVRSGRFS